MGDTFSARMTALEQQQRRLGVVTLTAGLRKEAGALGESGVGLDPPQRLADFFT